MPTTLSALEVEYQNALAAGDRPRAIAIFRRIAEMIKGLTPEQIEGGKAFLKFILDLVMPVPAASQAQELSITSMSAEEVESLGILDNGAAVVELITLLLTFIRRARAAS